MHATVHAHGTNGAIDLWEALGPSPSVPPSHTTYMCMHVAQTRSARAHCTRAGGQHPVRGARRARDPRHDAACGRLTLTLTLTVTLTVTLTLTLTLTGAAGWQNVTQRLVGPPCVERPAPKQRSLHEHGGLDKAAPPPRRACAEPRWSPRANVIVSATRGDSRGGTRLGQKLAKQVRVRAPPRR